MSGKQPVLRLAPEDYSRNRDQHDYGGGYTLRSAERDFPVAWRFLDVHRHGACVVRVAGVETRTRELQEGAFSPGRAVELRPLSDEDADAIAVWDASGTIQVGYVSRQDLYDARRLLFGDDPVQAIVLWDWVTEYGLRKGLNLLIARDGVVQDLDAPARRYERPPRTRRVTTGPAIAAAALAWVLLAVAFGAVGAVVGGMLLGLVMVVTLLQGSTSAPD